MRTKTHKVQFWLSDEEYYEFIKKSKLSGLNRSDYFRNYVIGTELKEKPDDRFYQHLRLLRSASNNINQIAKKAHSLGFIDEPFLRKEVDKIDEMIDTLKLKYLNLAPSDKNE